MMQTMRKITLLSLSLMLTSKERQQGIYFAENLDQIKQIIKAYYIAKDVSKKIYQQIRMVKNI